MLFTSPIFLFLFLPITLLGFFALGRAKLQTHFLLAFLILASVLFYGYKDPSNLLILLASILGNYGAGLRIQSADNKKPWLVFGVVFNVLFLAYFKYTNFILGNIGFLSGQGFDALDIVLPLAVSFYTFQQITYLGDNYVGKIKDRNFVNYVLYVTFFPQFIIGPIVHYAEIVPQFVNKTFGRFSWDNFKIGYFYIAIGLIKKLLLADGCGVIADYVFGVPNSGQIGDISFAAAWLGTIAFSFQIYFDFSAYSDIAMGLAKMFGIDIPVNFNSPYKSLNVSEFWRRWHITFSKWLSSNLYIPLGGSRKGTSRAIVNAFIVFLIGGLWHGAAWTFVVWGLLQGLGLSLSKHLERRHLYIPKFVSIAATFIFITLTWVVFRSPDMLTAGEIYASMFGLNGFSTHLPNVLHGHMFLMVFSGFVIFMLPNTHALIAKAHSISTYFPHMPIIVAMALFYISLLLIDLSASPAFIYFEF